MKLYRLKYLTLYSLILLSSLSIAQTSWEKVRQAEKGSLTIHYLQQKPFAYLAENDSLTGIEIDILNYFQDWLKIKKGIELDLKFYGHKSFSDLYSELKNSNGNHLGAATVTITESRKSEVKFSAPYLKNVSVLVSDGSIPTARTEDELINTFSELYPVTIQGSVHTEHLKSLLSKTKSKNNALLVKEPMDVLLKIQESSKFFGYTDLVTFWLYIKKHEHYVKMHQIANKDDERFAFIFPKDSDWDHIFNEFFESGFGFTATKAYRKILEKHLGYEVIDRLELN